MPQTPAVTALGDPLALRKRALAFAVVAGALGSGGCSGSLFVLAPSDCAQTGCDAALVCIDHVCVEPPPPCNPGNPTGYCPAGTVCVGGSCFAAAQRPPPCSAGQNGVCVDGGACQGGACVPIEAEEACGPARPDGLCPGGQLCVHGLCFLDDDLSCSAGRPDGVCPSEQICQGGTCAQLPSTCSDLLFDGTCGGWQVCVQGQCVGPWPPDPCAPDTPHGRCEAQSVCVNGTCTPIDPSLNGCSEERPQGLCPAGAACVEGRCDVVDVSRACTPESPTGVCEGGMRCDAGACVPVFCGSGGFACDPGHRCDSSECVPMPCAPTNPHGVCLDSTEACEHGLCVPPSCSLAVPDGTCPSGFGCVAGLCELVECSPDYPHGTCSPGEVCADGVCVEGPCSATNLDGVCTATGRTTDPEYGWAEVPTVCCDESVQAQLGCELGTCFTAPCSAVHARGACRQPQQYCRAGTCEDAPCSPFFIDGLCPEGQLCKPGGCFKADCAEAAEPDAYCAPNRCDLEDNICVPAPCDAAHPGGFCATLGEVCCNQTLADEAGCALGSCVVPPCRPEYPGGACPAGTLCAQGRCVTPPCSPAFPDGTCGPNFSCCTAPMAQAEGCELGTCQWAACDAGNPLGRCATGGERCTGGTGCQPFVCSDFFPQAPCPTGMLCCDEALVAADICADAEQRTCTVAPCTAAYPGGTCPQSLEVCAGGQCVPQPCSRLYPDGACGAGFGCDSESSSASFGLCVPEPCSAAVPNGTCDHVDPTYVCAGGVCRPYACSSYFPHGPCASSLHICTEAAPGVYACEEPPCVSPYIGGHCDAPLVCTDAGCVLPACSSAFTEGQCPQSQVCCGDAQVAGSMCSEADRGKCIAAPCHPVDSPAGGCYGADAGKVCLNGSCVDPNCSSDFQNGLCPPGEICIDGACLSLCDPTARTGWCPAGFACVEGRCAEPCAGDADCDGISDAHEDATSCQAGNPTDAGQCAGVGARCSWYAQTGLCFYDTDGDGSPDAQDRDADGDLVPDAVEAGDRELSTAPFDRDSDGDANFRDLDSDNDHISDTYEAGPAPATPRDTDGDGVRDLYDLDSDNDGIEDACEVADIGGVCATTGIVDLDVGLAGVLDSDSAMGDADGLQDYRDLDSDNDGIPDTIEARAAPADASTLSAQGVDHDGDGTPDYRDPDSDADGVADADEDLDGDGTVDCQLNGEGLPVLDPRPSPACTDAGYDYNPGCSGSGKCLLAETSRVHGDTDRDGVADGDDGNYMVCASENLKPVNVFYSATADYAIALEQAFASTRTLTRGSGSHTAGLTFDDPDSVTANGSWAVAGFLVRTEPSAEAMAATAEDAHRVLIAKALAQADEERAAMQQAAGVEGVTVVLTRNFTSFDGFAAVASRYHVSAAASMSTGRLRDRLAAALGGDLDAFAEADQGPADTDFTLLTETLYRFDDGSTGSVITVGALVRSGADRDDPHSFAYRTLCNEQEVASCSSRKGCMEQAGECVSDAAYQLPLFFADNITGGSALAQFGDGLQSLCYAHIQRHGKLDFLWIIDASISMETEIDQVRRSADLLIGLLNNSEADYRLGQATSTRDVLGLDDNDDGTWEPVDAFDEDEPECAAADQPSCEAVAGCIWTGGFCQGPKCGTYQSQPLCDPVAGCAWDGVACAAPACGAIVPGSGCTDCAAFGSEPLCTPQPDCNWDFTLGQCRVQQCPACDAEDGCRFDTVQRLCLQYACAGRDQGGCAGAEGCSWFAGACVMQPRNGLIVGGFTGAIAGQTGSLPADRAVAYDCDDNPNNCQTFACGDSAFNCCAECETQTGTIESPACYFASRLPCTNLTADNNGEAGFEFGLSMGQWALYRAGALTGCEAASEQQVCEELSGCVWSVGANVCYAAYCALPEDLLPGQDAEECDGNDPGQLPPGFDTTEDEYEPAGCEWDPSAQAGAGMCVPSIGIPCRSLYPEGACTAAAPRCQWQAAWGACVPNPAHSRVLCSAADQSRCEQLGGGWCEWDAGAAVCRPPESRALRQEATKVAVMLADEDDCYVKDHNHDGACEFDSFLGYGYNIADYDDDVRRFRTESFRRFYEEHGLTVYAIVGDKAAASSPPGPDNGGCRRVGDCGVHQSWAACQGAQFCVWNPPNSRGPLDDCSVMGESLCNIVDGCKWQGGACVHDPTTYGQCYANVAEAGNAYIDVAEGTGGGWGSICAADLSPTIESIVVASLAKASPYVLEAKIDGQNVQPIASTLQVAVEVCDEPAEYPACRAAHGGSGTHMIEAPRSREHGFDYDGDRNVLMLYGRARPALDGDIVASYRYWVDNTDAADPSANCPCPQTNGNGCDCPAGQACGHDGSTDLCAGALSQASCEETPGCGWNTADGGGCHVTGLCEPDPSCGSGCQPGEICDRNLGLCVCDVTCDPCSALGRAADCAAAAGCHWVASGAGRCVSDTPPCGPGQTCDNNALCAGKSEAQCQSGCGWSPLLQACVSLSCGQCLCDVTCGGGCPVGQECHGPGSSLCGSCFCDTDCGDGCASGLTCNGDALSPTCGLCEPPRCGDCPPGHACDTSTGFCVCDVTCAGGCPLGQSCEDDPDSPSCGLCACDPTCGGIPCPQGQACDEEPGSTTCGLCRPDPTCGGSCVADCGAGQQAREGCEALTGCRWAEWADSGSQCQPVTWRMCMPAMGLCVIDPDCGLACGPTESCDALTGQCVCDATCGYACAPGLRCDSEPASPSCGLCLCDTECGGAQCPEGLACDDNALCAAHSTAEDCSAVAGCGWDPATNQCLSATCGRCVVACGECPQGFACDPTTGLCMPACPQCLPPMVCDLTTGACVCDQTCGGPCALGQQCDSDLDSATCGHCLCDATCGGPCHEGQVCDQSPDSPTCGLCIVDPTCGGCADGQYCDPVTGLCYDDPACGLGCPYGYICDPTIRRCVPVGGG